MLSPIESSVLRTVSVMPRKHRFLPVGSPGHIIQRGVNRQICFTGDEDMAAYSSWLFKGAQKFGVHIHAWVLMTNHVHLLLTPTQERGISNCMQYLGRLYVRYFNGRYERTGTLFEDRFRSHPVQTEKYFMACSRYIELNPVRARMVASAGDYPWSSYRAQVLGVPARMWTPHDEYRRLGSTRLARRIAYRRLFDDELEPELIADIKDAQHTGFVLGTKQFRLQVQQLTGIPQFHKKRGRKPSLNKPSFNKPSLKLPTP